MTLDHHKARQLAIVGYVDVYNDAPKIYELQYLQAISLLETGYGTWWKGAGVDSNNMGAITTGRSWTGQSFEYRDSSPDEQGNNHWYSTKFRKYPTPRDGWADLVRIVYADRPAVHTMAILGNTWGVSEALYRSKYYLGFGASDESRIANHYRNLVSKLQTIATALSEILPGDEHEIKPVLKRNSTHHEAVKELQRRLGLAADGMFGPLTQAAVKVFQAQHDLVSDGIVGPKTWAVLDLL